MYEVEEWNNWDYPSHWKYETSFDTIEEARDYIKGLSKRESYRIIEVHPNE